MRPQTGGAEAEKIAVTGVKGAAELGQCANFEHLRLGHRYASMGRKEFTTTLEQMIDIVMSHSC